MIHPSKKEKPAARAFAARWSVWDRAQRTNFCVAILSVVLMVVICAVVPAFRQISNIINVFEQLTTLGFLTLAMTLVLIVGGIDLSLPFVLASAAVVGATYLANGGSAVTGCLIMLGVSMVFGVINGIAVAKGRMIPFIVTLSTMQVAEGFAVQYCNATSINNLPASFLAIGAKIGILPISVIVFLLIAVIASLFLAKTQVGRWYYMIGTNEETARVCGIPIVGAKFSAYVISSLLAGVAAMILTARLNAAASSMVGDTMTTDAISAAIIGGASLKGGRGGMFGAVLGALFITIISNVINLLGISYYIGMIIKGIIIAIVIGIDVFRSSDSIR